MRHNEWIMIFKDESRRRLKVQPKWIQNPNNTNLKMMSKLS